MQDELKQNAVTVPWNGQLCLISQSGKMNKLGYIIFFAIKLMI